MNAQDPADLLRNVREEVIGLLFNRHVFRTHQEIVRANPKLQGRPRSIFSEWAQVVYAQAAAAGVRRLAGQDPEEGDVNLVGFLELLIRDPKGLWDCFLGEHNRTTVVSQRVFISVENGFTDSLRLEL